MKDSLKDILEKAVGADIGKFFSVSIIKTLEHSRVLRVVLKDNAPRSLIIKQSTQGESAFLTIREAEFYKHIAPLLPRNLIPKCYLVDHDKSEATIVLEDLGNSYSSCGEKPSNDEIRLFIRALAELHSSSRAFRNLSDIWNTAFANHSYNSIKGRLHSLPSRLETFLELFSSRIDDHTKAILTDLFDLKEILTDLGEDTIIHGDAHFWNALYSYEEARLIDWGNTCLGFGEVDLAHAIAMNLPRGLSRGQEDHLLREYSNCLAEFGEKISLKEIWSRYQVGIQYAITTSISMWQIGVSYRIWWPLFVNITNAAKELKAKKVFF